LQNSENLAVDHIELMTAHRAASPLFLGRMGKILHW
jgi:hypothetical protein